MDDKKCTGENISSAWLDLVYAIVLGVRACALAVEVSVNT